MNLNHELERIMNRFQINIFDKKEENRKIELAEKYLNDLFQTFDNNESVCIYGAGIHTVHLLKTLTEKNRSKIKCIYGNKKVEELSEEIQYVDSKKYNVQSIDCDIIVISSYSSAEEIEEELQKQIIKPKIINIYKYFLSQGLHFSYAYYYKIPCGVCDIIKAKEECERERDIKKKDYLYRKIICMYFNIRDILHGKEWCKKYILNGGIYKKAYSDFINELEKLLSETKRLIRNRHERDIVINWIDAFRYDEIERTTYLKNVSQNSVFFENAYTVNPATSVAMEILMNGYQSMNDFKNGLEKKFTYETTPFLKKLKEAGYQFKYIGLSRMESGFSITMRTNASKIHERKIDAPMTEIQWEALDCILNADGPICCLIHQVCETHYPNLCTEVDKNSCCCWNDLDSVLEKEMEICKNLTSIDETQVDISRKYMDAQLEWYADFYQDNITKIYMSDHGKLCDYKFKKDWLHIMMMVQDNRYSNCKIKDIFSLNQMKELVENVLMGYTFDNLAEKYSNIMFVPMYNVRYAKKIYSACKKDKKGALQFVGIMTQEDKYICFDYGEELYFRSNNEEVNLISDKKYKKRVEYLKNIMGKEHRCIDVYKNEYYRAGKLLNDSLDIIPGETILFDEEE